MKELWEYRTNLINRLEDMAKAFRVECLKLSDPYLPLQEGSWNVHQVAAHTRDVNKMVYGLRAHRTAAEENPEFPNFDGEAHMAGNYDASESFSELLDAFVEDVEVLAQELRALPPEAWSRTSRHTTLGSGLTLQSWVEKDLAHIEEHLGTIKKLNQK